MVRTKAICLLAAFFIGVGIASAQVTVNTEGLTDAQKAALIQQAERMREEAVKSAEASKFSPERVNEWAQLGKNIAIAFTTVAKELGVAADEFLNSTTGKITLVLIIWKVAGQDIISLIIGLLFISTFVPLWVYFFRRLCMIKRVTTEPIEGHRYPKKTVEYYDTDNLRAELIATRWVMLFVLILIVAVGLFIAL